MNVFLIHGADESQLIRERVRVVNQFLPPDQRDENLTTFEPPGNRALVLRSLLPDLLAELGAVSFFPGAVRVAIVENLSDFWKAETSEESDEPKARKGRKASGAQPVERLIRYLETDFASTGSVLIFVVIEDPEQRRTVDKRKKLVQWIKDNGKIISFDSRPLAFALGDAILERNLPAAIALHREIMRKGRSGQQGWASLNAIHRQVQFLLQAKVVALAGRRSAKGDVDELLPSDSRANLMKLHSFPRKKYEAAESKFSLPALIETIHDLAEINRSLAPSPSDPYVADVDLLIEKTLLRLCSTYS